MAPQPQRQGPLTDGPVDRDGATPLERLLASTQSCRLQPYRFFVSWQGVMTLAYTGFPPAITELKRALSEASPGLKAENPGSRWPKTSLGALGDRQRLTPQQLQLLNAICREESSAFEEMGETRENLAVLVDRAAVVVYECRSLEKLLSIQEIAFLREQDGSAPTPEEHQRVLSILSEADDDDYWFAASRDGNRAAHYRGPAVGATLMHRLSAFNSRAVSGSGSISLPVMVRSFRERVDRELPGVYVWFADESLHVTLRALES